MSRAKGKGEESNYEKYLRFKAPQIGFSSWAEKKWVWVPQGEDGFVAGEVFAESGDKYKVRLTTGDELELKKDQTHPMNPPKFDGADDMSELSHLNEPSVFHNLKRRYENDLIYTYSGLFCVVVNPYKRIPIYEKDIIDIYRGKRRNEVCPHVYAVSDEAYRYMLGDRQNQSMLITGESGAGKTENTKKVIQYIAAIAGRAGGQQGSGGATLEAQLLECNPILESFGNAKTNKNDNSSRFGKFIKLQFNSGGQIYGANIVSYLLEKSRVVWQLKGERTFHIFYQLLSGTTGDQKKSLMIRSPDTFAYLCNSGVMTVDGVSDAEEFKHTIAAMQICGFSNSDLDQTWRLVSGILHLSCLPFKASFGDAAVLEDKSELENVATLFGVDATKLEAALLRPRIKAGHEIVQTQLDVGKATHSRDALSKAIYGRMFLWIVKKINATLTQSREAHFIGVLDIAGFEIFVKNSFEQLCINYTNERLQQFFNHHMFKLEQEEYMREKINWTFIDFGIDSQETIDLLDKKPAGILPLLDEETVFPKGSDESFLNKLHGAQGKNPKYTKPRMAGKPTFCVIHYAGSVEYDVTDWLEKNKDPLQDDLETVMKNSTMELLQELFSGEYSNKVDDGKGASKDDKGAAIKSKAAAFGASNRKKGATFITVGFQYKEQLSSLMDTLQQTHPHFVRCIIPNHKKRPGLLETPIVLEQLRCNGVLEGIRISRKGFPNRQVYAEFVKRYYILVTGLTRTVADPKGATQTILDGLKLDPEQYRFGLTKIFFRAGQLAGIEEAREKKIGQLIIAIQSASRGFLARRLYYKLAGHSGAAKIIVRNVRAYLDFKTWPWWTLFVKARPLLKRRNFEKEMEEKDKTIVDMTKSLKVESEGRKKAEEGLKNLESRAEELKNLLSEEKERAAELQDQKDKLDKLKAEADKKLKELEEELEDETSQRKDLADLKRKLELKADELQEQLDDENKLRIELESQKRKNDMEIDELKGTVEKQNDSITKLERHKQTIEKEISELRELLTDEGEAVQTLEKQKRGLMGEIEELREIQDDLNKKLDVAGKAQKKIEHELRETQQKYDDEKAAKEAVEQAKKRVESEMDELKINLEQKNKSISDYEKLKKKLEGDLSEAREHLEDAEEAKANIEKAKKKVENELEETKELLEEEQEKATTAQKGKEKAEFELSALKKQLEEALAKIAALEKIRKELEARVSELETELEDERTAKANLEKLKKKLEGDIASASGKLDEVGSNKAAFEKAKKKLDDDLKAVRQTAEDEKVAREAAERNVKRLETELGELKSAVASGSSSAAIAEKQNKGLQAELQQLRDQIDEESAARSKAEKAKKDAQRELEELQERLDEEEEAKVDLENARRKLESDFAELKIKSVLKQKKRIRLLAMPRSWRRISRH
eukprot:TRINITY_DN529_c0_g1_i8.p1 TRINITY_DN529_c0_g1~~TRINITY_DN529_c0_g1_i8.p1  ORF type:complete len:1417 (-),score=467.12 TRINITY_DN529_c0_g1_i8:2318-6529(-)